MQHKLSTLKSALLIATLATGAMSAQAATTLVSEGFDDITTLTSAGWVVTNNGLNGITDWFQGDSAVFPAQAGAAESYIGGNYNFAISGEVMDAWLISPTFSTEQAVTVSFWLRGHQFATYFDSLEWGSNGSSSTSTASFTLGPVTTATGQWTEYTVNLAAAGAGSTSRFAIHYTGLADDSNYIGVDSFNVTAVPEPATAMLFAAGLAGLGAFRRRRQH